MQVQLKINIKFFINNFNSFQALIIKEVSFEYQNVFMKIYNLSPAKICVYSDPCLVHSPLWVHLRNWKPLTVEVVERFLEKRLDGFGELFRMLSFREVGAAAMLSRAVAGLARGIFVFALPGSVTAVELALDQLILPELEHLVWERRR